MQLNSDHQKIHQQTWSVYCSHQGVMQEDLKHTRVGFVLPNFGHVKAMLAQVKGSHCKRGGKEGAIHCVQCCRQQGGGAGLPLERSVSLFVGTRVVLDGALSNTQQSGC